MAIPAINVSILNGSNGFRLDGAGESVSNAGDVNGDGFDDVIIGAFGADLNGVLSGSSYVVFGKSAGFDAAMNLSSLDGNNGFRLDGVAAYDFSGSSVSNAGDINGDGFDDLIIGARGANYSGSSYVVFGRASGFSAAMDLSSLDGSNGFRLDGALTDDLSGYSVSSAGDINDDGFDDLIVGVPYADLNGHDSGSSYVVFGRASGFVATLNLSSLDGSNGFRLSGVAKLDKLGCSVSSAGDVNDDGFDDVLVGARGADPNGNYSGSSYVVFGRASGFDAALDLSSLDGNNGFRLDGAATRDYSGRSVSSAGDVNGDGFDDLIVGAFGADPNNFGSGSSYVVFGRASGFDATLDLSSLDGNNGFRLDGDGSGQSVSSAGDFNGDGFADLLVGALFVDLDGRSGSSYLVFGKTSGFAAAMNLSSLDGNNGFRLDGTFSGGSVSSAGDINGDGFDDLLVGAFASSTSYVVFGGNFFAGEAVYLGTVEDDNLTGTTLAERFEAGGGNDRMTGLGGADVFHGDSGNDTIRVPGFDFQLVDGGVGNDTLALTGSGLELDLADLHDTIDGIETIDLTGNGNNTLTLTLPDLLSLSDTTNIFTVNGNAGDRVVGLIDGWEDGGIDGDYHIYTNHGTVLRLNTPVLTDRPIPGVISLVNLDGSNGFRLDGAKAFGSVSNAGDINGDGFDDVIVGDPNADPNGMGSGSSYVVFGHASGFAAALDLSSLDGDNGFRLDGETAGDSSGRSVSNAGDVNGDGFDDVIVGAPAVDSSGSYSGSSYVVFGRASGFAAVVSLSSLDGNNGFRLDGVDKSDRAGSSVSGAGDVNGDGYDDLIISAPYAGPSSIRNGSSYVVFGKASGFDAEINLSSLDGSNGFRLDGASSFFWSVSDAGDVNGDGFDDVIAGFGLGDYYSGYSQVSYVVFGKAAGFDAALNLSSLDGSNGFRLDAVATYDSPGLSVSSAGDVNGDGLDDVIVGVLGRNANGRDSGSSYVVFGKSAGFAAAVDLSSLDGNNGFRLDGVVNDRAGGSVSNAGDVNGDGFGDLIVGAYGRDANGISSGSSYVVFGKATGFSATVNLSALGTSDGVRLDGVADGDGSGYPVSSAGDVNGDGFDDLLIGSVRSSSYVIFGRSDFGGGDGGSDNVISGTPGNDNLKGTAAAEIFEAGDGNDKMIGRGGADVFHGGAGDDYVQVADLGFGSVDGGSGNDVLHTDGRDLNLDLANLGNKIHGIEAICLYGRGDNTLTLTATNLLDLSDTTNTLRVNGNAGDRITVLDDGWVDGGPRGSGYYHVYTNDDAVLLVGHNVAVDFA